MAQRWDQLYFTGEHYDLRFHLSVRTKKTRVVMRLRETFIRNDDEEKLQI